MDTEIFKTKAVLVHGKKYNYSKSIYKNLEEKILIICPRHGQFWQKPMVHLSGCGCQKCGRERSNKAALKSAENKRTTFENFVRKASKKHKNKYKYLKADITNTNQKIKINCPIHGDFDQIIAHHLSGSGCPKCYNERRGNSIRKTTKQFVSELKAIYKDTYDYSRVNYINAHKKVEIVCLKHGSFFQPPHSLLRGEGCKKCSSKFSSTEQFVTEANKIHKCKYDYSKTNYININEKIIISCPTHGIFEQISGNHIKGSGCPKCGKEAITEKSRMTFQLFKERSQKIHESKYFYEEQVFKSQKDKIKIICPIHGEFIQVVGTHLQGSGCPICKSSKGELKVQEYLRKNKIIFELQKTFENCRHINPLFFDFYLPKYNICIEFDGKQHFESIEKWGGNEGLELIQLRDSIKTEYCKQNDIPLLRIKYDENVENKLKIFLFHSGLS